MARTVQIELDVQDAKAVAAWQRSRDSLAQFHKQLDGVDGANKKNQASASGFFGEVRKGIGSAASAVIGFTGVAGGMLAVVQQLRAEYDNIVQRQKNAADVQVNFQTSLAQAVRNATGIFSADETLAHVRDLAKSANLDPARAASLVGSALTSTGVQNAADARLALASAKAAAIFAPDLDVSGLEATAGVAASLAKKNKISPEAAIGFIQRVGTQANVRQLTPMVENIAPGVAGLQQLGFSEGEAGSLIATITQITDDSTGKKSTTGAVNFAQSLRERFREDRRFQRSDGSFDPIAAITALQQNDELRRRFLEGGKFGGKSFGGASVGEGIVPTAIEALVTRNTGAARQFAGGIESIGTFREGKGTFGDLVTGIRGVTQNQTLRQTFEAVAAQFAETDPEGISAELRSGLEILQKSAGTPNLSQKISRLQFEAESRLGTDPNAALQFVRDELTAESADLRDGVPASWAGGGYNAPAVRVPGRPATARELELAAGFDRVVDKLDEILRDQRKNGPPVVNVNAATGQVSTTPPSRAELLGTGSR